MPSRRAAAVAHPAEADTGAARVAILAAARAEFSAKGLAGARVNEIAARAGVNKQLIYYYFGSKDDLYRAALEAVYTEIRSLEQELRLGGMEPEEAMAALVSFSFDYLARHPDFIGLINHENARKAAPAAFRSGTAIQSLPPCRRIGSPTCASPRRGNP